MLNARGPISLRTSTTNAMAFFLLAAFILTTKRCARRLALGRGLCAYWLVGGDAGGGKSLKIKPLTRPQTAPIPGRHGTRTARARLPVR
jgi:hypothetical protein